MFSNEELKSLDRKYFAIIAADEYDVTVMSLNTGHYWYIHNPEYPGKGSCIIFHKHKASHPYHQHGRALVHFFERYALVVVIEFKKLHFMVTVRAIQRIITLWLQSGQYRGS